MDGYLHSAFQLAAWGSPRLTHPGHWAARASSTGAGCRLARIWSDPPAPRRVSDHSIITDLQRTLKFLQRYSLRQFDYTFTSHRRKSNSCARINRSLQRMPRLQKLQELLHHVEPYPVFTTPRGVSRRVSYLLPSEKVHNMRVQVRVAVSRLRQLYVENFGEKVLYYDRLSSS